MVIDLYYIVATMMINRMPFKSQPMNMVHRSRYGTEIWLGDYFAATNVSLLKQKDVKSGIEMDI